MMYSLVGVLASNNDVCHSERMNGDIIIIILLLLCFNFVYDMYVCRFRVVGGRSVGHRIQN